MEAKTMSLKIGVAVVLAVGLGSRGEAGGCVVAQKAEDRVLSAMLCKTMAPIGIVRAEVGRGSAGHELNVMLFFDEGDVLSAFSDPSNREISDSAKETIRSLDEMIAEQHRPKPRKMRLAIFSTEETSVLPRIVWARQSPGGPVKLVRVTDGLVDQALPKE